MAAARPGKRDRRGDPRAEQQQGHAGDEAEIAGERVRLFALVEIDDERAVRLAAQMSWNGEHAKCDTAAFERLRSVTVSAAATPANTTNENVVIEIQRSMEAAPS